MKWQGYIGKTQETVDMPIMYTQSLGIILFYQSGTAIANAKPRYEQKLAEGVFNPLFPYMVQGGRQEGIAHLLKVDAAAELTAWFEKYEDEHGKHHPPGLSEEDADFFDDLFEHMAWPFTIDRHQLRDSEEGWVFINVEGDMEEDFEGFAPCPGILVWNVSEDADQS